jgi:hypothetical protein
VVAVTTTGALDTPVFLAIADAVGADLHDLAGQAWRERARCRGESPEQWHPPRGASIEGLRRI